MAVMQRLAGRLLSPTRPDLRVSALLGLGSEPPPRFRDELAGKAGAPQRAVSNRSVEKLPIRRKPTSQLTPTRART